LFLASPRAIEVQPMSEDFKDFMTPWHEQMQLEQFEELRKLQGEMLARPPDVKLQLALSSTRTMVINAHATMQTMLCDQLLAYVHVQSSGFFEDLIIDVVLALGYAGRRRDMARKLGRSGDGGIDGVIDLDELGLDALYLQAKRLKPGTVVSVSAVRDFVSALEAHRATKGVFVTTGNFSPAARGVVEAISKKIVLINGQHLTQSMVRFNIGTKVTDSLQFKEVDLAYFANATARPVSSQPRK
jgi:restriction system protein